MRYITGPASSFGYVLVGLVKDKIRLIALGSTSNNVLAQVKLDHPSYDFIPSLGSSSILDDVLDHFDDPSVPLRVPVENIGTAFQHKVWEAISAIPLGSTRTYAQLAQDIGQPKAVRAVAQACGKNGLAVIVPCHRVVGSDGGLGGYRWGVERKKALLEREREYLKCAEKGVAEAKTHAGQYPSIPSIRTILLMGRMTGSEFTRQTLDQHKAERMHWTRHSPHCPKISFTPTEIPIAFPLTLPCASPTPWNLSPTRATYNLPVTTSSLTSAPRCLAMVSYDPNFRADTPAVNISSSSSYDRPLVSG